MQKTSYKIDYGFGKAALITPHEPEEAFYRLANECFGIRKSISKFEILSAYPTDPSFEFYEGLSFNGDIYAWRQDGARRMIMPDYEEEWDTNFCALCVHPSNRHLLNEDDKEGDTKSKKMDWDAYQEFAYSKRNQKLSDMELLMDGVSGLSLEANEAMAIVAKHLFQGHELDINHLAVELGDALWYLAVAAKKAGYSLEKIMEMNVEKLQKLYPEGFDTVLSTGRDPSIL